MASIRESSAPVEAEGVDADASVEERGLGGETAAESADAALRCGVEDRMIDVPSARRAKQAVSVKNALFKFVLINASKLSSVVSNSSWALEAPALAKSTSIPVSPRY